MFALSLTKLRRQTTVTLVSLAFFAACGVPDYRIEGTPDAGHGVLATGGSQGTVTSTPLATGGVESASGGGSALATGGQPSQDPFNCGSNEDCSSFSATRVCDTSSNRCVECLPSVTDCGAGLYCGADKSCHVGCSADADCGEIRDCDAAQCDPRKCNTETHECQGCLSDLDCQPGALCDKDSGACVPNCGTSATCPTGWTCCHQGCVNLRSDAANCASCDTRCDVAGGTGQCLNGSCRIGSCKTEYRDCDKRYENGCEVSRLEDNANCGECGVVCSKKPDICLNGVCGDPACGKATGYADCDNDTSNGCETNTDSNVLNCGSCNLKCSTQNGTPTCSGGQCAITCASGYGDCDKQPATGCEVDLTTTAANCGACGATCTNDHGSTSCLGGKCSPNCGSGFANCDGNPDNGCETTKTSDVNNCGDCGHICSIANGTASCTNGACTIESCRYQWTDCNNDANDGCESNPVTDAKNCGTCGHVCNPTNGTPTCVGGSCRITCNTGFANCDGDAVNGCEVDTDNSVDHCGSCSHVCLDQPNGTAVCRSGSCDVSDCKPPFGDCDKTVEGCETNTNNDPQNCGGCGNRCVIPNAKAVCAVGVCGVGTCHEGYADCNGDPKDGCEVNLKADVNNCNACGSKCAPANANGACVNGACTVTSCVQPYQDCNNNPVDGCEANTDSSVANCGNCGVVCDSTHGTPSCSNGVCGISCSTGYGNCDGDAKNGCEATLTVDANNCGTCLNACAVANGALGTCVNSICSVDVAKPNNGCNTGFADCNGKYSDGCEARLTVDSANCGKCGNLCNSTNGVASCNNGECFVNCAENFGNCDGLASTGCESSLSNNLQHCGNCNKPCAPPNGTGICTNGACTIAGCAIGHDDCNAILADGCETNLMTNPLHCGTCKTLCSLAHATPSCNSGVCAISACDIGFADCDGNPANGCEVNTTADPTHCGSCSKVCNSLNGFPTCNASKCGINCDPGFGNCDNDLVTDTGCEINLNTDVNHCKTCNAAPCSSAGGTPACVAGSCTTTSCTNDYADCDGNSSCETYIKGSDINNCGGCSAKCTAIDGTPKCTAGACGILSCNADYADCDGNVANGCEANLKADVNNCNACGAKCSTNNGTPSCTNGTCTITCNSGYQNCNADVTDGCEVQLGTVSACATCGNACSANHGTPSCTDGACGISCNPGYFDCNNSLADGCEVNIAADPNHCGTCSTVCNGTNGAPTCANGTCGIDCSAGFGNCDNNLGNGCETNTTDNVNYCGSCGRVCSSANGSPICSTGECSIRCNDGFGNCNGDASDGCEANYASDTAHCGSCTTACVYANAAGVCNAGTCQLGSCFAPFENCDHDATNGCEVAANTTTNCNGCNIVCTNDHGSQSCAANGCTPGCDPGYLSCDGNVNNGCEQNVRTDTTHCGTCTNVCQYANATPGCTDGSCVMGRCNYMFDNCNGNVGDGCETSLSADLANCGACGNACNDTNGIAACSSGACSISCNGGYQNCDTLLSNGCEVNTANDANNCGTCGHVCPLGCTNGLCNSPCSTYSDCTSEGRSITVLSSKPSSFKPATANLCYEYSGSTIVGGNCGNFGVGGTIAVNDQTVTCNFQNWPSMPAKNYGGYCFHSYSVWQSNNSYITTW